MPLAIPTFSSVVISPDGTRLVYVGTISGGPPKLLTRRLDQPNATELAGTEGAMNPFFSRDGQWVAFWTGKEIYKVPVDGGGPVLLGEFGAMTGGDWDDEGNLVIGTGAPSTNGVLRLPSTGGAGTPMLELANGELFHTHPQILPGGKAMLLEVVGTPPGQDNSTVDVVSIADRARKTLARGVGSPRYLPSGHLVYTKKATMFAVPFDLERMETRGTAVAVLDDVAYDPVANGAQYDVSRTGTLVYRRRVGDSSATVQWLDTTGKQEPLLASPGAYVGTPRVSPDGKRIAITIQDGGNQDIWVYEPERACDDPSDLRWRNICQSGVDSRRTARCLRYVGQRPSMESCGRRWPAAGAAGGQEHPASDCCLAGRHAARVLPAGRQSANLVRSD